MELGSARGHSQRMHLADRTLAWSLGFLDRERHLVWNPSWYDGVVPARTVHLVPGSAWTAYGLLARRAPGDLDEASAIISTLLDLQYDAPGTPFDGTFATFAESPRPPSGEAGEAVVWRDYDPNWRQFLGTTFVLVLEDFGADLPVGLVEAIEKAVGRAVHGEPEGRIALDYTNPGLMHAFLLAWYGNRAHEPSLVARGEANARAIVERFDELGTFDEHNSPTYYGIDLLALALWRELAPTPSFAEAGARVAEALWNETLERYNPTLRNWCGPYTRSYGPDATRSVTLLGLWYAAVRGEEDAPLPPLPVPEDVGAPTPELHHANDVMAGPVIARLAGGFTATDWTAVAPDQGPASRNDSIRDRVPGRLTSERLVLRDVGGRALSSWIAPTLMIGAESSDRDWPPSGQGVPVCLHWLEAGVSTEVGAAVAVLWMPGSHVVHATAGRDGVTLDRPDAPPDEPLRLLLSGAVPSVAGTVLRTLSLTLVVTGDVSAIECRPVAAAGTAADHEVVLVPPRGRPLSQASLHVEVRSAPSGAG